MKCDRCDRPAGDEIVMMFLIFILWCTLVITLKTDDDVRRLVLETLIAKKELVCSGL